jgi:hypothetical protein
MDNLREQAREEKEQEPNRPNISKARLTGTPCVSRLAPVRLLLLAQLVQEMR